MLKSIHFRAICSILLVTLLSCGGSGKKKSNEMSEKINGFQKGSYGYDREFLKSNGIETAELKDENSGARILCLPGYQGRVMTSSAKSDSGTSFGWINHDLIASGETKKQFNPVGGEERFWLGPEGGPYAVYFAPGKEQVFKNWQVPPLIDTEPFGIKARTSGSIAFEKQARLTNSSGTVFNLAIERKISLLSKKELDGLLPAEFSGKPLDVVAYQSENTLTNTGEQAWTREKGLLSIWILSMFNPSPETTVFIPYKTDAKGPVVNDDYFGKVPSDRLIVEDGIIWFKIDGKYRSKIGVPPQRAEELCGSYDAEKEILTLVWGSLPPGENAYVNSKWGDQDDPYAGDAVNAYNDGPVEDGSIMGPFYEIETSSPGAELEPEASLTHIQRVIHIQGDEKELGLLVRDLFGIDLREVKEKF